MPPPFIFSAFKSMETPMPTGFSLRTGSQIWDSVSSVSPKIAECVVKKETFLPVWPACFKGNFAREKRKRVCALDRKGCLWC